MIGATILLMLTCPSGVASASAPKYRGDSYGSRSRRGPAKAVDDLLVGTTCPTVEMTYVEIWADWRGVDQLLKQLLREMQSAKVSVWLCFEQRGEESLRRSIAYRRPRKSTITDLGDATSRNARVSAEKPCNAMPRRREMRCEFNA